MKLPDYLKFQGRKSVPVIITGEAAECGLACLAMVATYYGYDVDLNILRQRFKISLAGLTLRGVMSLAEQIGLSGRALRLELSALAQLKVPAVIHWDFNHFVVLKSVGPKNVTIHDPARGAVTYTRAEFSDHFTGVALELAPAGNFEVAKAKSKVMLTSLWTRMPGAWETILRDCEAALRLGLGLRELIFATTAPDDAKAKMPPLRSNKRWRRRERHCWSRCTVGGLSKI